MAFSAANIKSAIQQTVATPPNIKTSTINFDQGDGSRRISISAFSHKSGALNLSSSNEP